MENKDILCGSFLFLNTVKGFKLGLRANVNIRFALRTQGMHYINYVQKCWGFCVSFTLGRSRERSQDGRWIYHFWISLPHIEEDNIATQASSNFNITFCI